MSKINLNNYEAYMLDLFEGNLSSEDTLALKAFAVLHPELELNFEDELISLETETISFTNKQSLKASFNDELVIGYLENILQGEEKKQAEKLAASNVVFIKELELYKKTIAIADTTIVFENKERLKRRGAVIFFPQNNFVRVAAAIILLFGLWFMVSRLIKDDVKGNTEMAIKPKENTSINSASVTPNKIASQATNDLQLINENKFIAKKTNNSTPSKDNVVKEEINTSTLTANVPDKELEPKLVDNIPKEDIKKIIPDTSSTLLANNTPKEKVGPKYIIEEGTDNELQPTVSKSKLWNFTSGVLKRLNRRGVETVNATENNNEILIGALTISKPN